MLPGIKPSPNPMLGEIYMALLGHDEITGGVVLVPLLLGWFDFDPSMDKQSKVCGEIT